MFVTSKAQDLLTYSRSTTGTYIGSDGLLKTAAVDEARIEYDGSGNLQGLLLEPISSNKIDYSEDFSQWQSTGTFTLTAGQKDPRGGNAAYLFVDQDGTNARPYIQNVFNISADADNRWTVSLYVKKPATNGVSRVEIHTFFSGVDLNSEFLQVNFDSNGSISSISSGVPIGSEAGGVVLSHGYEELPNGWYRIHFIIRDPELNTTLTMRIFPNGRADASNTGGLLIFGAQVEQNHMVTSYIPTSGTEVTRQPDKAYIDIDQFGVKQDRGTFVAEVNNLKWFTAQPSADFPRVIEFGNTTNATDRLIPMLVRTDGNLVYNAIRTEDVFQASFTYEDYADSADVGPFSGKVALRYDETSARAAENGVLIGNEDAIDDIVGQPPFRTRLALKDEANLVATGNGDGVAFHIKTLQYYPRKLADHEISLETYYGTINTTYYVTNSGSAAYAFTGGATGNNPTLDVVRGNTYAFSVNASGHPFYLTTDDGTNYSAGNYVSEYTTGVTNSRSQDNTLFWTVDASAPNTLYYQCGNHAAMKGTINITG